MSPSVSINFSDVEEFSPLAPGQYPVTIDHVEVRVSQSDSTSQYFNWDLIVSDGEFIGRHIFFMTSLKPKSLWRLKAVMQNLGVYADEMNFEVDDETGYVVSPELAGLPGMAVVENEVYEGRLRDRCKDLLPAQGDEMSSVPAPVAPAKPAPRAVAPVAPAKPAPRAVAPVAPPKPVAPSAPVAPGRQTPPPVATKTPPAGGRLPLK